ncbi:MAG: thioredoxin domain-containing protein [Phycisphaerales bacterium]|nr:thioredoxin domain-containing protein [Phycisphaerales bacterium]
MATGEPPNSADLGSASTGTMVRWILGLTLLTVATVASGLLLMKEMGVIDVSLPGCGAQSACGDLSRGFFGSVPGIGWPTSYLGFTYFLAMLVAWSACWPRVPGSMRWVSRLGVLFSIMFMIVILVEWKLCPYCITAHVANLGFWIIVEWSSRAQTRGSSPMPAFLTFAFSWIIVTALLAGGQAQADHFDAIEREANSQANMDEIVQATLGGGSVNPLKQAAEQDGTFSPGAKDDPDDISFKGKRTVVNDPNQFKGRYLKGSPEAPVKVVMLSDYQCPDCKRFEDQMWTILENRDDVSLSVIQFPFNEDCNPYVSRTLHSNACWAAKFAETAGILGGDEAFWKAHRMMFKRKGRFTTQDFPGLVKELGYDPQMFQNIMVGPAVDALIAEDVGIGGQLGVFFTPMIFINGVQLKWYQNSSNLALQISKVATAIKNGTDDGSLKAPPTTAVKYVEDWRDGVVRVIPDTQNVAKGRSTDEHSIVLFADYTDPTTRELHARVEALRDKYPGIRYNILAFPKNPDCNSNIQPQFKDAYPSACDAALAVKAAGKIGGKNAYWSMIDFLMANGQQVTLPEILAAAEGMGLNKNELVAAMASKEVEGMVQTDILRGRGWGLRSVPAIFVDGKWIPRWRLEGEPIVERVVKLAVTGEE